MCGIWGISDMNSGISRHLLLKMIRHLMILSETRGKDASGIAHMRTIPEVRVFQVQNKTATQQSTSIPNIHWFCP